MSAVPRPPFAPMEALEVGELPVGDAWQYEPKWDGFRCLLFRFDGRVDLQSKAQKPLGRYFPDVVAAAEAIAPGDLVLDGELLIPLGGATSFEELQLRLHPAASRVAMLAKAHPALLVVFDLLARDKESLIDLPLARRRAELESFADRRLRGRSTFRLSPATTDPRVARRWLQGRAGLDGVIAKRLDLPYRSGERGGMQKVKRRRTIDCVVGGFRYGAGSRSVASLLLGLYDRGGLLHHVGFTSSLPAADRPALTRRLERLVEPPGFTGAAPGGPSRWSSERSGEWQPLRPKLVVEIEFDHFTGGRMRHGAKLLRWRPDKAPSQCTFEQIERSGGSSLGLLASGGASGA